jgi:phosphatidylserine/phosphatidylglycerophosphate/cardiolipin synthase-like enzyme
VAAPFIVTGSNAAALFTLKIYRGDSMVLLAMNWKTSKPPDDFVGFAIEYKEPGGHKFFSLKNRLAFTVLGDKVNPNTLSTRLSPIQKFRWVHFPRNADLPGAFTYRVSPVFMNGQDELSYGDAQEIALELRRETYPGQVNLAFTRGYVASQAFVDLYGAKAIPKLLPKNAADGLKFKPTYKNAEESQKALAWMGFEAREAMVDVLDKAIADAGAQAYVVAYDLNEPQVVSRLVKLGNRLKVIVDDSDDHGRSNSAETAAWRQLVKSAGASNVIRQRMKKLQHNKTIVVDGPSTQLVVCGSTNFSWRGLYVQNNSAVVLKGAGPVGVFKAAFDDYWKNDPDTFGRPSIDWTSLGLAGIDAQVTFSPHTSGNERLKAIGDDIKAHTKSTLFYSLAFLYQTQGPIRDAITAITKNPSRFVYGISDRKVGGLDVQKPNGNVEPVYPSQLSAKLPEPFKSEPTGGFGTRMHHKFVVIDFDDPATARVYLGSYNFSPPADTQNGENLLLVRDQRIAVSYLVEALRIFDHYHFRVTQNEKGRNRLVLAKPPRKAGEKPWFAEYYGDRRKIRDRELFA